MITLCIIYEHVLICHYFHVAARFSTHFHGHPVMQPSKGLDRGFQCLHKAIPGCKRIKFSKTRQLVFSLYSFTQYKGIQRRQPGVALTEEKEVGDREAIRKTNRPRLDAWT